MYRKIYPLIILSSILLNLFSCVDETTEIIEKEKFVRIYDKDQFAAAYRALDIQQTTGGGLLILATRDLPNTSFEGIYLVVTDDKGEIIREVEVDATFVNAIPGLTKLEDKYYFFCMSSESYQSQLMMVDEALEELTSTSIGVNYPSACSYIESEKQFLLLGFDPSEKQTIVTRISSTGAMAEARTFSAGVGNDIVDEQIMNHFHRTGKQFPFQVGKASTGVYFFNGFFEYNFSLVFTNLSSENPMGSITGEQNAVAFNVVSPLTLGDHFAISMFNNGTIYLSPRASLSKSGHTTINNITGYSLPEIDPAGTVKILRTSIKEKGVLIYAVDTKSKQIGLLFYDEATGQLMGSRYLGFSNPYEIGNLIMTSDGGLAVCGTTYIAGRFPRVAVFKLSKGEVEENVR